MRNKLAAAADHNCKHYNNNNNNERISTSVARETTKETQNPTPTQQSENGNRQKKTINQITTSHQKTLHTH